MGLLRPLYSLSRSHWYGFVGLGLIAASFLYWYLPFTTSILTFFSVVFVLGNILFFDFLSFRFSGFSLLHAQQKGIRVSSHFILAGTVLGILLEGYGHWLGKFFYFPYWSPAFYFWSFIPGWAIYAYYLTETYFGTKAVIERFFIRHHRNERPRSRHRLLFLILGAVGAVGIGAMTVFLVVKTTFGNNFRQFLSIVNAPFPSGLTTTEALLVTLLVPIFVWFFFEYLEYERHETSMISEALRGNLAPVVSVFLAAWLSALLYEIFNAPGRLWIYANVPYANLTLFHVPIAVYLLWPVHYFPLFSMYRVFFKKDSGNVWR